MFQYYAMLSGGKCARLFGFRSEGGGGGGGGGRGGTSNPFIDRNAVKEAGGPGGGGVTSTQAKLSMQNSIHQSNII